MSRDFADEHEFEGFCYASEEEEKIEKFNAFNADPPPVHCPLCLSDVEFPLSEEQAREIGNRVEAPLGMKKLLTQVGHHEWVVTFEKV